MNDNNIHLLHNHFWNTEILCIYSQKGLSVCWTSSPDPYRGFSPAPYWGFHFRPPDSLKALPPKFPVSPNTKGSRLITDHLALLSWTKLIKGINLFAKYNVQWQFAREGLHKTHITLNSTQVNRELRMHVSESDISKSTSLWSNYH